MAEKIVLQLESRSVVGKKVKQLRRDGLIPVTVYGKKFGPFNAQLNAKLFTDMFRKAGRTRAIEVKLPGQKAQTAFIHTVQRHPITRNLIHADLLVVDAKVELVIAVPVHVINESELAKQGIGVVNIVMPTVEVRALPANIPSHVEADISVLDSLDKNIHASDLIIPGDKVTLVTEPDAVIVAIVASRVEVEESTTEETAAEPELVRKEREDGSN